MAELFLPLLKKVDSYFKNIDLKDTLVIACLHILETNYTLFQHLFKRGLKPENVFLAGKCYSANKDVMNKFKKKGVNVEFESIKFDSHLSFDEQFNEIMKNFLIKIKKKINFDHYKKIILIDDGGFLIYHANKLLKNVSDIVAVEQTSSGYEKLKNEKLKFPVINVARSITKLKIESGYIAETFMEKMLKELKKLKLKPKKILLIGAGYLGRKIVELLKKDFEVHQYDTINKRSDFGNVSLNSILGKFDLIVGSTGKMIIKPSSYKFLKKGVILVSASSSDKEFSAVNLRKKVSKYRNCHRNIILKNVFLLNSGFPINFDGKKHSTGPEKIQLTRALMLSGIYLSLTNNYKDNFIDLDKNIQNKILKEFKKL